MEIKIDIPFNQLVQLLKKLPEDELRKLKVVLNDTSTQPKRKKEELTEFQEFLLKGPVFSKEQIDTINDTRKRINKWRTK